MKEELIDHIRTQLTAYEVTYRDGAWERFNRQQDRRRRVVLWRRVGGAAAILLFTISIIPPWGHQEASLKRGGLHATVIRPGQVAPAVAYQQKEAPRGNSPSYNVKKTQAVVAEQLIPAIEIPDQPLSGTPESSPSLTPKIEMIAQESIPVPDPLIRSAGEPAKPLHETFEGSPIESTRTSDKWRLSFAFSQAVDNRSKTDLSFGIDLAYKASGRLSVASGLHFDQFGGGFSDLRPDFSTSSGKVMTGSQASLQGIGIPLDVEIRANGRLYARTGVAAYAVLTQRQQLDYTEQKTMVNTYLDPDGNMRSETVTINEFTTESVPEEQMRQRAPIFGIYHFAVGWRQQLTKKKAVSIEPFIKVPLNRYSEQNLNLAQGGIRLKVDL